MLKRDIKKENAIIKEIVEKINGMSFINKVGRTKGDYIVILTTIKHCSYDSPVFFGELKWIGQNGYSFNEFDEPILGDMCKYIHAIFDSYARYSDQVPATLKPARKIAESVLKQITE